MLKTLRSRRSVRRYQKRSISKRIVRDLKETCLRAPSSRGLNPWKFYFVTNKNLLGKLSEAKEHGSSFLQGAPLGVVICGDERRSDVWIEDCSIAAILLQMTAQSHGLGSCWIQIRKRMYNTGFSSERYVQKILNLPAYLKVECMIALGYPAERKAPVPAGQLPRAKILTKR